MSHEPNDLEPTLYALQKILEKEANWQVPYILFLWMSVIVLVPFDLSSIDSSSTLIEDIISVGSQGLKTSTIVKDTAALMLAKLLTRPDVKQHFSLFIAQSIQHFQSECIEEDFYRIGLLKT